MKSIKAKILLIICITLIYVSTIIAMAIISIHNSKIGK